MRTLLLLLLVACGSSEPTPKSVPAPKVVEADPNRAATNEECGATVDHILGLPTANEQEKQQVEAMKPTRDDMVKQCAQTSKKHDIDCAMATTTFAALGTCPPPGSAK